MRWSPLSVVSLVGLLFWANHCGSGPDGAPMLSGQYTAGSTGGSVAEGPCQAGEVQACKVVVGHHDGYTDCYKGVELCENGFWGPCEGKERVQEAEDAGEAGAKGTERPK